MLTVDSITRDGFTTELHYDDETGVLSLVVIDGDDDPWSCLLDPADASDALAHPARYGAPLCRCSGCRPPQYFENEDGDIIEAEPQEIAA